ncbi:MAG TPA: complex I NDUFA9 subunit family protein [Gemmatimonadales bacterium]|jgi:NADH dehydrogenase
MKVALTGGTGFVGRQVVEMLMRREHEVRLLVREPSRHGWLRDHGDITTVAGDLENPAALKELVQGVDAVVNLVGIIVEVGRQTWERVHVQGTRQLLAAAQSAGVKKFVQMSALGARLDAAATAYHRTKAAGEALVRAGAIPSVILRPSLIAAPGNEVLTMIVNMLRMSPIIPVIGNGLYRLQPIAGDDVAEAFALSVEDPGITGTFDIAGPASLTYHEILDQLEEALGVHRRRVAVPVTVVRFSAYAGTVLPHLNPITPDQLQMLLEGNTTPQNAITSTFGIKPREFAEVAREIAEPWAATPVHSTQSHS